MNIIRLVIFSGLVSMSFNAVMAEDSGDQKSKIEALDIDKNGALSKTELDAASEELRKKLLEFDTDKDGALSKEEVAKAEEPATTPEPKAEPKKKHKKK